MRLALALILAGLASGGTAQARPHHHHHHHHERKRKAGPAAVEPVAPPSAPGAPQNDTSPAAPPATAPAASTTPPAAEPPAPVAVEPSPAPVPVAVVAPPPTVAADSATVDLGNAEVDAKCLVPAVTAVDPLRSGTTPGALPELAPPALDVLGASLQYNVEGAALSAVVAPAGIGTRRYIPVVSDLRVQVWGRDNFQRLGGSLLVGWDSASAKLADVHLDHPGPCDEAREILLQKARFDRAYRRRFVVGVRGGAELLPLLFGPKVIDPASGAYVDAEPQRFGGYSVVAHLGYYQNRSFGMFLTGGIAGSRALGSAQEVALRGGAGLDVAYQLALGPLRPDGFQPGITFGAFGRLAKCASSDGCAENVHGYDTPISFDLALSAGGYIDLRLSNLVQLRLAVPTNYYVLHAAPAGSSGGDNVVEVAPTVALSVASWGL